MRNERTEVERANMIRLASRKNLAHSLGQGRECPRAGLRLRSDAGETAEEKLAQRLVACRRVTRPSDAAVGQPEPDLQSQLSETTFRVSL